MHRAKEGPATNTLVCEALQRLFCAKINGIIQDDAVNPVDIPGKVGPGKR